MTEPFARYDIRGYRTVDVAAGYAAWAPFYDATMDDRLDLPLLASLASLDWRGMTAAVDLACGTGRIGSWLKARGVERVDGVDVCSAMLDRAAAKGSAIDWSVQTPPRPLVGEWYDLTIVFCRCHMTDLGKLYAGLRLIRRAGRSSGRLHPLCC
jgi:SAM-dependent methyltransferase